MPGQFSGPGLAPAIFVALLLSGCSGMDAAPLGEETAAASQEAAAAATDEAAPVAVIEPQGEIVPEPEPTPPLGEGTRLPFRTDLTPAQRAMVEEYLPDAVEISGGAAADVRVASVDLNGDGLDEAVVMIHSGPYCGSGDVCNLWMFQRTGSGWRQIDGDDDAANAVFVMPETSAGYHDVALRGECGTAECDFLLSWAGSRYHWANPPTSPEFVTD